jgi:spore coat protein JB
VNSPKQTLKDEISALSFAAVETNLYLDGHPNDKDALRYYKDTVRALSEKTAAYEKEYGPLLAASSTGEKEFLWSTTPWPWQEV